MRRLAGLVAGIVAFSLVSVTGAGAESTVLWSGDSMDDWYSEANSGQAFIEDVTHPVLGAALRMVNENVDGSHNAGARINQQGFGQDRVLPVEAWYSATFLVPYFIDGQDNVFQFKQGDGGTRQHLWNVGWKPVNGELRLIIRTRLSGDEWQSRPRELAELDAVVPIGVPFRLEVFRRASTGADGRYEVRLDGRTVWEFDGPTVASNLDPRPAGNQEWVLSHYLGSWQGDVNPATSEIFITDARISTGAASGTVATPQPAKGTFRDDDGSVHEEAIEHLVSLGIVKGCDSSGTLYCPANPITRAEFVAMLVRVAGGGTADAPFPDVPSFAWFAGEVGRAAELGIVIGHADGYFRPHSIVTRAEAAAMIVRLRDWAPAGDVRFYDVSPTAWYHSHVDAMYAHQATRGCATDPLRFCPDVRLTRAEAASFVSGALR
jgi:hypothetical protein